MRPKGIEHKELFYVTRIIDTIDGNYFEYSNRRIICNPEERHPFYLKIGGIVYAKKKKILGSKKSSSAERFKESDYYGSYLFYADTDLKLRVVVYCRRIGLPQGKFVSGIGVLHSVIPRYDGSNGRPIIGMFLDDSNTHHRKWTKYDERKPELIRYGYQEFHNDLNYGIFDNFNEIFELEYGIYVGENTSIIMIDETSHHLFNDRIRNFNYTLFQTGALIVIKIPFYLKFYNIEESELVRCEDLYLKNSHLMPTTENLAAILERRAIIFLKSAPNLTFWTLRCVSEFFNFNDTGRNVQLCVPTGGQFERVTNWETGIHQVKRRQWQKPWNKYISLVGHSNSFDDLDPHVSQAYPNLC